MKYLKRYNELILLPVGLLLFWLSPHVIHWIDPTSATYDFAVFQKVIFGMIIFSFSTINTWVVLKITFPRVFKYLIERFDQDFASLTETEYWKWKRLVLSFAVLSLYLLGLLLSMQVL